MDILYIFLLILLEVKLICLKSWRFKLPEIDNWQYFKSKQSNKNEFNWQIYSIYPHINSAITRAILVINCLMVLFLCQILLFWWVILVIFGLNLFAVILGNFKIIQNKVMGLFNKKQDLAFKIVKIIGFRPSKNFALPAISQPKITSVEQFEYLIDNFDSLDEKTRKILLSSRRYFDYRIDKFYQKIDDFGLVDLKQELTPKIVDDLYQINQKIAFVKDGKKVVNLVFLKDIGIIKNSTMGQIVDMVDPDLPRVDWQANLSDVIETLVRAEYNLAIVIKNGRIIGLVELADLLKMIKLI